MKFICVHLFQTTIKAYIDKKILENIVRHPWLSNQQGKLRKPKAEKQGIKANLGAPKSHIQFRTVQKVKKGPPRESSILDIDFQKYYSTALLMMPLP